MVKPAASVTRRRREVFSTTVAPHFLLAKMRRSYELIDILILFTFEILTYLRHSFTWDQARPLALLDLARPPFRQRAQSAGGGGREAEGEVGTQETAQAQARSECPQ